MNKLLLALILIFALGGVYPIPVNCHNLPHLPISGNPPISQVFGHLGHIGTDYKIAVGSPVYAIQDGIVIVALEDSRVYGRAIWLLHCDGFMSIYGHLSELKVKFGEVVRSGQLIGLSGGDPGDSINGDGWSSGAHLHLEIRTPGHLENSLYNINPELYFDLASKQLPKEN